MGTFLFILFIIFIITYGSNSETNKSKTYKKRSSSGQDVVSEKDIEEYLKKLTNEDKNKETQERKNAIIVACPRCDHQNIVNEYENIIKCKKCGLEFSIEQDNQNNEARDNVEATSSRDNSNQKYLELDEILRALKDDLHNNNEAIRRAEEARKRKEDDEKKRRAEEVRKIWEKDQELRRADEDRQRREQEEERRRADEDRQRREQEEARRRADADRQLCELEEAWRRADEECRIWEKEEAKRKAKKYNNTNLAIEINCPKILYHFTDIENLESIRSLGGLYSWRFMKDNNLTIPRPGGNDLSRFLDTRYQDWSDYVRLSFCKYHPMINRLKKIGYNIIVLKIDSSILSETSYISDRNATANGAKILKATDIVDLNNFLDFEAINYSGYIEYNTEKYALRQAEVLIKTKIPSEFILDF